MKTPLPVALAALALLLSSHAAAEVRVATFHSASLGRDVSIAVQIPPSYETAKDRTFPVVYALHGLFESHLFWERRGLAALVDALWAAKKIPELLIVAVDGGNSFFVNSKMGRYEDLVTRDLPAHVESAYRVLPGRAGRALLGVSMGGYAALHIAFEQPGLFAAVATHSAMLLERIPSPEQGAGRWHMAAFTAVFGDPIDPRLWAENDPLAWARKADPKAAPALYFDCGSEDRYGLFAGNGDLHHTLDQRGVAHTFELAPGNHGYEFVRGRLERSLGFLGQVLAR